MVIHLLRKFASLRGTARACKGISLQFAIDFPKNIRQGQHERQVPVLELWLFDVKLSKGGLDEI